MENAAETKLLPCPFCGEKEKIRTFDLCDETTCITCDTCNAQGGYYGGTDSTSEQEASTAWNTRALTAPSVGALEWVKEGERTTYLLVNNHPFRRLDNWGDGDIQEWRFDKFGKWKYAVNHDTEAEARAALEAAAREWLFPAPPAKGDA